MMGIVWCIMLLLSVMAAIFQGNLGVLTPSALEGAASAVTLCISLAGALCLWSGVAKVMEQAGLIEKLGRLLRPIFRRLFPKASQNKTALGYLTANISANLLGLGNAATPMGIAAIRQMYSGGTSASDEMCLLIVMNSASIQLLPTTVAAVRSSLGAAAPFDVLPAVWLTSVCSVCMGIAAAKLLRRWF
ncbi:MAG: spore maturation protein A [Ruminococcaceae bacterium]|nr:spore maturation protein A [Oscillospiraceae bacterium]